MIRLCIYIYINYYEYYRPRKLFITTEKRHDLSTKRIWKSDICCSKLVHNTWITCIEPLKICL